MVEVVKLCKTQYICRALLLLRTTMKLLKDETLSIRTSADIKQLLRLAAEREHRSVASMIEVLVLTYAHEHGLGATSKAAINAVERK